jgi:ribonucleotide monophosphatase NagD (HAD superfamily)
MQDLDLDRLSSIKAFIIDMDGVLYTGQQRLPGARKFLTCLQDAGVHTHLPTVRGQTGGHGHRGH